MNSSDPSPSCRPTKVEVPKELPKVSMVNTSLKKLKYHLTGFDVVVKERTMATAITEGSWGFEHTKACFRDEIIPFVKALKDIFNTFDQYLIDELTEVQNVFHQMEQAVEQHHLESKTFEVKMNQVLNENKRLLKQVINKDIVNIIMNSTVDNDSVNMHECKKCLKLETELLNKKDFIEKETYDKLFRSYTTLEKHCISVKALKDIFNTFDQYLIDELTEVQNVFHQMKQAVEQHRSESKTFKVKMNQVLNENERLLEQVINKDIVNIIMNSTMDNAHVNMHECKKCLKLETELLNKNDFIEKETYDKLFRSYTTLEKHCISLEVDTQLNQEIFQRDNSVSNQSASNFDQYFELNELKAQSQEKYIRHSKELKERIKSLSGNMNEDKVKKDIEEIETINIELDHKVSKLSAENEHLKHTYKQLYDSIKPTPLKNELRKLKGKDLADNVVTKNTIAPEMLKIDVEPIAPKLLNNRTAHSDYLRHTHEQAVILKEHFKLNADSKLLCVKCNGCMLSDNHDLCVLNFINDVNARVKSKSVKKSSKRKVWKPTGKVFTNIGYNWRPTGRTFTIVGNACPLTRITTTVEVPLRKITALETDTPKPVVTLVYSRKPRKSKTNVPVSKPKIVKSISANNKEPSKYWGSIVFDVPSSSLDECSKFLGTVKFGNDHVAKIIGYGDYKIGNVTILRVYYVEGLGHNLFFVGQFCDSNLKFAFRQHTYFIRNLEGDDLLTGSRGNNPVNTLLLRNVAILSIYSCPKASRLKAVATACYTQNRSIIRLRHDKTPYELLHDTLLDLSFLHVFGVLCYPTNDSENLGKLQPRANIEFDELTSIASEHSNLEPALHEMTPAIINLGLVLNSHPSTPFVPPSRTDWDLLCQPLFDELLNPLSSVDHPAPEVIAPIAEVVASEPVASTGSPSSTSIDQDAPSPSNSQTLPKTQSPVISIVFEKENHDLDVAHMNNDPLFGILILENDSEASSSLDVIPTIVHIAAPNSEHVTK
ncbi:hypothetical protein Tco_0684505 [Tanacetum coccineum]